MIIGKHYRRAALTVSALLLVASISACGRQDTAGDREPSTEISEKTDQAGDEAMTYEQITQEEAKNLMDSEEGYIILDVRTLEEYEEKHIPGAICIPVEAIGNEAPDELPDKDQLILVYCRSGNRSKTASGRLANLGYTNIREFGGINTWPYETVTGEQEGEANMPTENAAEKHLLKISDGTHEVTFKLNDSPASRSLLSQLPLTTEIENYGSNEKIFYPDKLDCTDTPLTNAAAGTIAYFEPWGDVVLYYEDAGPYNGLYELGYATDGKDTIVNLEGTVTITAE